MVNMYQIRSVAQVIMPSSIFYHCFVYTSSEYMAESAIACIDGRVVPSGSGSDGLKDSTVTAALSGGQLTKENYGSIWAIYPHDADGSGAINGTQQPDSLVVVGTLQGKGVIGK